MNINVFTCAKFGFYAAVAVASYEVCLGMINGLTKSINKALAKKVDETKKEKEE